MRRLAVALVLAVLFGVVAPDRAKAQFFLIDIDTAILNGQNGNIDLQFNPGGADALAANAEVHRASTDGSFGGPAVDTGGATGMLPGGASIDNSQALNELFQPMTFGNTLEMVVCFSGPALDPIMPYPLSGSTFSLSLYDPAGVNPLLTTSPDGSLLHIDINPDGTFTTSTFPDGGGTTHATITALPECPTPEFGSVFSLGGLLAVGGLGLWLQRRQRRVLAG